MRRAIRAFVLLVSTLLGAASPSAAAGTAGLLRDINLGEDPLGFGTGVSGPLVPAGNRVVFPVLMPGSGGLWASDGTAQGTRLLRNIVPEGETTLYFFETVRQTAVFAAGDRFGPSPAILWRSDGTVEGTFTLHSGEPGRPWSCGGGPLQHAVVRDLLFYTAIGSSSPCELWVSDGTRAWTRSVLDIGETKTLKSFTAAGNRLFFVRLDSDSSPGLWISDGTRAGTDLLVEDVFESPRELTAAGSRVFFIARAVGGSDEELWTSDGTPAGTRPVTRFFEPLPFPSRSVVAAIDGVLYFLADDGTGFDLWQSNGTAAGTRRVTDFASPFPFPGGTVPATGLARLGTRLVFSAREEGGDWRLWLSEGTPATTAPLEGCPGGCPRVLATPMIRIGNRAVFSALRAAGASDLWVTDGTGSGTRRLAAELCIDSCNRVSSDPPLVPLLGKVFFIAAGSRGFALWRTDGTPAGTVRLADLGSLPYYYFTFTPVQAGGRIFFAADPGDRGLQLWSSDGTPEGSGLVTVIGGSLGSAPSQLTPFAEGALFTAFDGVEGGLWRSDGTPAGTVPILSAGHSPRRLTPSGGLTFFLRLEWDFSGRNELWRTDGTEAGTFRVNPADVEPLETLVPFQSGAVFLVDGEYPYEATFWQSDGTVAGTRRLFDIENSPEFLRSLGPDLYFLARDESSISDTQLWVSDGTAGGTRRLTDFHTFAFVDQEPPEMARIGGTVYFAAEGRLWKTDGTAAGTVPVLPPDREGSNPSSFVEFHGALFFIGATDQVKTGRGLWRSDGTAAGTFLVKPVGTIQIFPLPPEPAWPTVLGDRLFFVGDDGEHGIELWSTDGTPGGTVLVRDIAPGEASARPSWLTVAAGRLYFAATDDSSGIELWESDGTAAGTRRVQDIAPGAGSSHPKELTASGNHLYFAADDGVHGEEPWALSLMAGGGCVSSADALCLGGRFRVEADWRDFQGNRGPGRAVALTADTGYFWFFDAANVEVILKVLDGRGLNGHHWVFYGALSNVEYSLTVTDTQTGAARRYINPPGRLGSVADTEAFGPRGASVAGVVTLGPVPAAAGEPVTFLRTAPATLSCVPNATRLCLNNGRFAVEARWTAQGQTGTGQAVSLAGGETGYFWFFDANNVEVVLKVLDGTPLNGKFWVFYGALSDVEYTLTVTDTVTGAVKTYTNPSGRLASVADTGAFE
jgi:ELWxxDGT repeat protein